MYRKAYIFMFVVGAISFLLTIPTPVSANAIVAIHDWDVTPVSGVGSWAAQGTSASVSENTSGADDYMQINFSGTGSALSDTVKTPASELFAGTWKTDHWIEFDFWAKDAMPGTLQIRWGNNSSGRTWGNDISANSSVGSWGTLRSDTFADYTDWDLGGSATESQFMTDLEGIDWIGVYIFRDGNNAALYGVDDFKLMVPEPAEYLMIFAALGAAVIVIRRKNIS